MKKLIILLVISFVLGNFDANAQNGYHSRISLTTTMVDTVRSLPVIVEVKEDTSGAATLQIMSNDSTLRVVLSIKKTDYTVGDFIQSSQSPLILKLLPCWDVNGVIIVNGKKMSETEISRLELGFGMFFIEGECSYDFSLEIVRPEGINHVSSNRGGTIMYAGDFLMCGNPYISEKIQQILQRH